MTAKISRGLVSRIYSHAFEQGWLEPGAIVLDPFGGICGTGLDALWHGLNYVAVELEPKFVALGEANLALWHRKYGSKLGWGTARIVQGDSRRLAEIVGGADLICGSPPYSESITGGGDGIDWKKIKVGGSKRTIGRASIAEGYGTTPGQLGRMKEGEAPMVDCVMTKFDNDGLPCNDLIHETNRNEINGQRNVQTLQRRPVLASGGAESGNKLVDSTTTIQRSTFTNTQSFGGSPIGLQDWTAQTDREKRTGALGMEGRHGATELSEQDQARILRNLPQNKESLYSSQGFRSLQQCTGESSSPLCELPSQPTQEGVSSHRSQKQWQSRVDSETFWEASRTIIRQCHQVLKPQGMAIWIVKDFVRAGKRVPFSDQWLALCEQVGFSLVCRHKAMLVKSHGRQHRLDGEVDELETRRISLYRRLAEKKGSPKIECETVICVRKG